MPPIAVMPPVEGTPPVAPFPLVPPIVDAPPDVLAPAVLLAPPTAFPPPPPVAERAPEDASNGPVPPIPPVTVCELPHATAMEASPPSRAQFKKLPMISIT
jgi:hypothetical protein